MIENRQYRLKKFDVIGAESPSEVIEAWVGKRALRWYIAQVTDDEIVVEATLFDGEVYEPEEAAEQRHYHPGKSVVLSVIPTGVGCELGGYAGDAAPATNLLAATADYLVTNPNAVNASNFISLEPNVLYTEGLCIDLFIKGLVDLYVPYANKIGLIVEKNTAENLDAIFNVVNTVRAVHGIHIVDCLITDQPIGSHCVENGSGAFVGTVDRPGVIFEAAEKLIERGADAIAITTNIQDLPLDNYTRHFEGDYPNPLGGVEAIISHLLVNRFQVPAAHAPSINCKDMDLEHGVVDARGAGEMTSVSGLACTLIGLRRAPQLTPRRGSRAADVVNVHNVVAAVMPAGCLGGIPAIYAQKHGIPIIAVEENRTVIGVTQQRLGIKNVITVRNYLEAAGAVLALKQGIHLGSVTRPLPTMRHSQGSAARRQRRFQAQLA
jgi:uncharacterized protein DUF3326